MSVPEISAIDARRRVADHDAMLLDCREHDEVGISAIRGAMHIPMSDIPDRLAELPRQREIVVFCHHGMRSLHTAAFLREQGFADVKSMRGGIEAWAEDVDPSVPRY
ncbi:MAG: rhodanese-like domain-containing protein [Phycisphaerae bacterium]